MPQLAGKQVEGRHPEGRPPLGKQIGILGEHNPVIHGALDTHTELEGTHILGLHPTGKQVEGLHPEGKQLVGRQV